MKKKVALFVNGWNGENVDNFISGFSNSFSSNEVDLFVFTSYSLAVDGAGKNEAEDAIYSLPDVSFFDAVIIFGSGMNSDEVILQIIDRCKKAEVPVILQGMKMDGVTTVTVDSNIGMKNLCEHLIVEHGVKDVIFIAGPEENEDSNLRKDVVTSTFEAHGYGLTEDNIFHANWEGNLIKAYMTEHYADRNNKLPDAFICANDQMAMFAVLFLIQLGYKVPDDIIVTGFDNVSDGKVCFPSLATVNQGYDEQGAECAKLVMELIGSKCLIRKSIIPCTSIPGESCGCFNCNGEEELRRKIGRMWWSERYFSESLQGRVSQLDMCIMSNERYENIHQSLNNDFFSSIGEETEDFHIYINPQYKELVYMNPTGKVHKPYLSSVMDVLCARTGGVVSYEDSMDISEILLGYNNENPGKIFVFKSLKVDDFIVGYMVMGYKKDAFKRKEYIEFSARLNRTLKKYQRTIDDYVKAIRAQEQANAFLRQTVEALATAVDANDSYTNGHSNRVAKYSRMIAKEYGMTEKECDDVYLAGLLHDVGKIGIDNGIINKKGKLTDEEFAVIKLHPQLGGQILSKIVMSPSLSIGAHYHHERYDGKGYPERLKGDDIPLIARIIAVADAYDAMTSVRSYRDMLPQVHVREELVKGIGTQFDPEFVRIMLKFLDEDYDYTMREWREEERFGVDHTYMFDTYKSKVSAGIRITDCPVSVRIKYKPFREGGQPTLLFYDSSDARYYLEDGLTAGEMDFVEYARVDMNGTVSSYYVRNAVCNAIQNSEGKDNTKTECNKTYIADIFMVKKDDHLFVRISTEDRTDEMTLALYDSARYIYFALTGEFCTLEVLDVKVAADKVEDSYISRIADKITYTDGPTGDIPNVQMDAWMSNHSDIVELDSDMNISFHTMSLPSSKRVWHCPIVAFFTSNDGVIGGKNFKELAFIRLDGEVWCNNPDASNETLVFKDDSFGNWGIWKQKNKDGVDCKLTISRQGNIIDLHTENGGFETQNRTVLPEDVAKIYVYLTGDQCALTDIHINRK